MHQDEKKPNHPHEPKGHPDDPKKHLKPGTVTPPDDPGGTGGVGSNDPDGDNDDDTGGENPNEPPGNP